MDLPTELSERLLVHEAQPLAGLTTLGVGGPAPFVLEPRNRKDLMFAVGELHKAGLPLAMLGHGSNLLVSDEGLEQVVLHTRSLHSIYHHGEIDDALRCEAGAPLSRLVSLAHAQGLSGAEMLIGIPGTVGGAVAGNSGGREGTISDILSEVTVVESDGTVKIVPCIPGEFAYRNSPFAGQVVLDAVVQLKRQPKPAIMERMTQILKQKALTQPLSSPTSGCMFKNPLGHSAGQLIDVAGCKDLAVGSARVSTRHGNFFVNEGGTTAAEVMSLVAQVQQRVLESAGVRLELEVELWGAFGSHS
ncbi:MAG: UDP-N-acetylmuramate dehydrogenase [Pseudohongiellaceae bacterium]|jgi:UDP-N-acetylmuramate dehydrogenase